MSGKPTSQDLRVDRFDVIQTRKARLTVAFLRFPWVFALFPLRSNSWVPYVLAVFLNTATVYIVALAIVRIFASFRERVDGGHS